MKGLWVPKQQSNVIQNLIAQLNSILEGNYFVLNLSEKSLFRTNKYYYVLELTSWGLKKQPKLQFLQISEEQQYTFSQMHIYLNGIINGIKLTEFTLNNK